MISCGREVGSNRNICPLLKWSFCEVPFSYWTNRTLHFITSSTWDSNHVSNLFTARIWSMKIFSDARTILNAFVKRSQCRTKIQWPLINIIVWIPWDDVTWSRSRQAAASWLNIFSNMLSVSDGGTGACAFCAAELSWSSCNCFWSNSFWWLGKMRFNVGSFCGCTCM